MKKKIRIDTLISQQYPQYSKAQIQSFVMQGLASIEERIISKAGTPVPADAVVDLKIKEQKFVCRAGYKLDHALDHFSISVDGLTVLDAGLSTGGFTDSLLQRGAKKIYGVDVGFGQVHEKIRQHPQVVVLEKTNLRTLKKLDELVDLVTLDLSFISVLKVMDSVCALLKDDGQLVILVKPQFEAEKGQVPRGGVIKDENQRQEIVDRVVAGVVSFGFDLIGLTESPILGGSGNMEYLAYFKRIKAAD